MPNYTTNYNLKKPLGTENYNIDDQNGNMDIIDTKMKENANNLTTHLADDMKHIDYATASGTNTYTATIANITALTEGLSVKIKFTNANTASSTLNINGLGAKTIQKGNGNTLSSGNIKAGQIIHLVYTGSVFQLLGEGGEYGTATADKVVGPYTIGTDNGIVAGTMTNQPYPVSNTQLSQNGAGTLWVGMPLGAYLTTGGFGAGTACVQVLDVNFLASNIINGKTIFGLSGTAFTPSAGETVYLNETAPFNTTSTSYIAIGRAFTTNYAGTIRLKFLMNTGNGAYTSYGRIYKNGVAIGTERITTSTAAVEYIEDFVCSAGDSFQIYAKINNAVSQTFVSNFRVCLSSFCTPTISLV